MIDRIQLLYKASCPYCTAAAKLIYFLTLGKVELLNIEERNVQKRVANWHDPDGDGTVGTDDVEVTDLQKVDTEKAAEYAEMKWDTTNYIDFSAFCMKAFDGDVDYCSDVWEEVEDHTPEHFVNAPHLVINENLYWGVPTVAWRSLLIGGSMGAALAIPLLLAGLGSLLAVPFILLYIGLSRLYRWVRSSLSIF